MVKKNKFIDKTEIERIKEQIANEMNITLRNDYEVENLEPVQHENNEFIENEVQPLDRVISQNEVISQNVDDINRDVELKFDTLMDKYKNIPPNNRPVIPKIKYDRRSEMQVREIDSFLTNKVRTYDSLEHINLTVYVAAMTVCSLLKLPLPDEQQCNNRYDDENPPWKVRLEKKIANLRSDLTKLFNWSRNGSNRYINILYKYNLGNYLQSKYFNRMFTSTTDSIKQHIAAISKRLRRYNKSHKRRMHNKHFTRNEKRFYANLEKQNNPNNYYSPPQQDQVIEYWKNIWSNPVQHNKNATWIKEEVERSYCSSASRHRNNRSLGVPLYHSRIKQVIPDTIRYIVVL
ncbi:hypothetical protein M8J76_010645 [Diaphorina citri]|nr:hypothetical protein M8J76_010645 [Diaphorina citri]